MASHMSLALLLLVSIMTLNYYAFPLDALKVNISSEAYAQAHGGIQVQEECSKICQSSFCNVAPLLRYGKYCGILYGGCPGEKPCDELDACCMKHDDCIGAHNNNYLNVECNRGLKECVERFKNGGRRTFEGNKCDVNDVTRTINVVMDAAILEFKTKKSDKNVHA